MLLAGLGTVAVPSAAVAQACQDPAEQPTIREVPWAQKWLDLERVRPLSEGSGVLVAVVDSGVDARHSQLDDGRVLPGRDLVEDGGPDGQVDCNGHGTAVASIIAAATADGVGFSGLAPGARILPVRVTAAPVQVSDPDEPDIPPEALAAFAEAITWAADQGAGVINVSIAFYGDHEVIADAVRYAQDRDVLVVAAVGNMHVEGPDPTPYPAAYPEVLGVGAFGGTGAHLAETYVGPHVDLVAPGDGVTVAVPRGGHQQVQGTSFATPFVSATAALVRAAEPDLSAAEVAHRLIATAAPAGAPDRYGHGQLNPYRALTEQLTGGTPAAAEPLGEVAVDPVAVARAQRWQLTIERAVLVAGSAVLLSLLAVTGTALWRRGQRRHWRPALPAATVPEHSGPDDPERVFYTVPKPRR